MGDGLGAEIDTHFPRMCTYNSRKKLSGYWPWAKKFPAAPPRCRASISETVRLFRELLLSREMDPRPKMGNYWLLPAIVVLSVFLPWESLLLRLSLSSSLSLSLSLSLSPFLKAFLGNPNGGGGGGGGGGSARVGGGGRGRGRSSLGQGRPRLGRWMEKL